MVPKMTADFSFNHPLLDFFPALIRQRAVVGSLRILATAEKSKR